MKLTLSLLIFLFCAPLLANDSDGNETPQKPSIYDVYQACVEDLMDNWGLTFEQAEKRCAYHLDEAGSETSLQRTLEQLKLALNDSHVRIVWIAIGATAASRWLFLNTLQKLALATAKRSVPALALVPPEVLLNLSSPQFSLSLPENREYPAAIVQRFLALPVQDQMNELRQNPNFKKYILEIYEMIETQRFIMLYQSGQAT
ncbi:MAG: hypothetical protein K2Q26_05420 [Bdellovibrionales bacterium]|nr:hypothetical protein [Bdellovibrionales bacterium]